MLVWPEAREGPTAFTPIQNKSGLPQGPAGASRGILNLR